jgi:transposase
VKRETLEWLAENPSCTKRFAFLIGRRCRGSSIRDVAKEHLLDWHTVKDLEMQYMREQIKRAGKPRPKVIGVDEISIRKGHTYRIVVSDLERRRPIWFGGKDRSEESMNEFFSFLEKNAAKGCVLQSWTCGSHSGNRRTRMLPKQLFSSISSTSFDTWARLSTR